LHSRGAHAFDFQSNLLSAEPLQGVPFRLLSPQTNCNELPARVWLHGNEFQTHYHRKLSYLAGATADRSSKSRLPWFAPEFLGFRRDLTDKLNEARWRRIDKVDHEVKNRPSGGAYGEVHVVTHAFELLDEPRESVALRTSVLE
jgi:hypothetical protein